MTSETTYTIQEIRNMLVEMAEEMNIYKYLEAAVGIEVVQQFLESIQTNDGKEEG